MASEADQDKHGEMHDEKDHQETGEDEMKQARRLVSADEGRQEWEYRGDRERHREPGPDDAREKHEEDEKIGQPLDHIVGPRLIRARALPTQMIPDHACD